jgi:hypothetical protein
MKSKTIKSASHTVTNKILDFGVSYGHMAQQIGEEAEIKGITPIDLIYPCEIVPEEFHYEK